MNARVFLLVCAATFAAATILLAVLAILEGRAMDGGFLMAAAFTLAFLAIAIRMPAPGDGPHHACNGCGRRFEDAFALSFCHRCGERRA